MTPESVETVFGLKIVETTVLDVPEVVKEEGVLMKRNESEIQVDASAAV